MAVMPFSLTHAHLSTVQGDHSACSKPPIDIDLKVVFYYKVLIIKPEFAAVTVSPVTAVMVMSPVAKSSPVRSPVKEWSPVKHF